MPATSPKKPKGICTVNVHELTKARLASGVTVESIAEAASVTVQAVKDCSEGNGAPEANRRIYGFLSNGIMPKDISPVSEPAPWSKAAAILAAGDRLAQAISHAFIHLPERVDSHTHVLGSADLCCRMTCEADLAVDRDRVQAAITAWHTARRAL